MTNQILGRLTLQSGHPIQTSDQTSKTIFYYAPCDGCNTVPIYDGSSMQDRVFTSSDTDAVGLSFTLDSNAAHTNYHAPINLFDVFAYWTGTVVKLGTSPKYATLNVGSDSIRDSTALIQTFRGIDTNASSITLRFGVNSGDTVSVTANKATWVGTIFVKTDGTLGMPIHPSPIAGGTGNILCVWNRYNRKKFRVVCTDSTTSWTYGSTTLRLTNNSDKNRIWWPDGLADIQAYAKSTRNVEPNGVANIAYTNGVAFNDYLNLSGCTLPQVAFSAATNNSGMSVGEKIALPVMGLNYVQELEESTVVSAKILGNDFGALVVELWL